MSSSKIFKDDPSFKPITLIRQEIIPDHELQIISQVDEKGKLSQGDQFRADVFPSSEDEVIEKSIPGAPDELTAVDIKTIEKEAYERGRKVAIAEAHAELSSTLVSFNSACQKIDTLRSSIISQNRSDIINLVISLTRKIIGRELETNRDTIATNLENALEKAITSDEYHVTLHPDDLETAERIAPDLISSIRGLEHLVFHSDSGITRGGCLLESNICAVDATIEHQLETAKEFLTDSMTTCDVAASSVTENTEE